MGISPVCGLPTTCTEWNTILPIHVGARFQPSAHKFQPFVGADALFLEYKTDGFALATGLQGRGGFDAFLSDAFGLDLNVSVGYLYGKELEKVERDVENGGMLWQATLGTLIAF